MLELIISGLLPYYSPTQGWRWWGRQILPMGKAKNITLGLSLCMEEEVTWIMDIHEFWQRWMVRLVGQGPQRNKIKRWGKFGIKGGGVGDSRGENKQWYYLSATISSISSSEQRQSVCNKCSASQLSSPFLSLLPIRFLHLGANVVYTHLESWRGHVYLWGCVVVSKWVLWSKKHPLDPPGLYYRKQYFSWSFQIRNIVKYLNFQFKHTLTLNLLFYIYQ